MSTENAIDIRFLKSYGSELAQRMRSALNIADGVINLQECLKVASDIERLGEHMTAAAREDDDINVLGLRHQLNIKHMSAARILYLLMKRPDLLHSQHDLAAELGCSARSIPVYMSHLRQALGSVDLKDMIHVSYRSGYYVTGEKVAKLRAALSNTRNPELQAA